MKDRAGIYIKNLHGYSSFTPKKLPPEPPLEIDSEMQDVLSSADRNLGRLDGIAETLPNPELFVAMYVKKEALLSSQIEGTQASLVDVLDIENSDKPNLRKNVDEVVNYVAAMKHGLARLNDFPLSLRLIREIHDILLKDVRGSEKSPGEFRTSQNWIGPQGCDLFNATFVPPTVDEMTLALRDLELFMHDNENRIPALIKIAFIHAQFETIHPFLDGNGRVGRLLITFWLCQQNILTQPLLYLSYFFKKNRAEYYDRLMDIRKKGAWEEWVKFFLSGISEVSEESIKTVKQIIKLKENFRGRLYNAEVHNKSYQLLDSLFSTPIINREQIISLFKISSPTAGTLIDRFCELQILKDMTPDRSRNKKYVFSDYLTILERGTENLVE